MTCHYFAALAKRFGYDRKHNQRFRCLQGGKTWIEPQAKMLDAMRLDETKALLALALHSAFYNFCRLHQTLRVAPAREAGITDHVWGLAELPTG